MAANAHEKLRKWRENAKKTLGDAGKEVRATATAWFEWERGDIPALHTAQDLERLTRGAVSVDDWSALSRAKAEARAAARRKRKRVLSSALKTGTHG